MNKKPLILRTVIAVLVVAVFVISLYPLRERDFFETFRSMWKDPSDPVLVKVVEEARELQAQTPEMFPSEALLQAARQDNVDLTVRIDGKNLQDNRDVIAEIRKLSAASIRRGLDLAGGAEFVMRIVPDAELEREIALAENNADAQRKITAKIDAERDSMIETLRKRMEQNKIYEVEIYPMGSDMISLRVPVISNDEKLRMLNLVKMSAQLRFALVHPDNADLVARLAADPNFVEPGYTAMQDDKGRMFFVSDITEMTGKGISNAGPAVDQYGQRSISLTFNSEGAVDFAKVTKNNVGRELAIVLDGKLYCAPVIRTEIPNGRASIDGQFTMDELKDISDALVSGGMRYVLTEEAVFDTDPTLGADNIRNGVYAGIGALLLVFLFMCFYYRLGGLVASLALGANIVMILGALAAFNQTLTLPGIAGIVLTMGMAVDINVLIFERIREEQRTGKTLAASLDTAYSRVFPVIVDAYLTAFFTSVILLNVGTGAVKGFAITMLIGIFTSVFCGVFLTRLCFDYLTRFHWLKKLSMMEWVPADAKVKYLKSWKISIAIAAVMVIGTAAAFAIRGGDAYSVDFTGGTTVTFDYVEKVPSAEISAVLSNEGFGDAKITYKTSMAASDNQKIEILIRGNSKVANMEHGDAEIEKALNTAFPEAHFSGGLTNGVSGLVGWEFTKRALLALGLAFLCIVVYISFRYEFAYAMAALIALFFDVIAAIGIYLVMGREISLVVIAAILTIIGYSINDKIVIFDRIRENLKRYKGMTYIQIVNLSINQTLARTLLTSLTTLLVLVVLLIFGGIAINDFVLVMFLGVVIGTLSSIFLACPLVAMWHRRRVGVRDHDTLDNADLNREEEAGKALE